MQILKQSGQIETERFEYREIKWISSRGQQFFFLNINHLGMSSVTWHAWWWIFSARDFSVVLFTYCLYCTHFYLNHNYFPRCPCTEESLVYTWIFVVVFMLLYQSSVWMPLKKNRKGWPQMDLKQFSFCARTWSQSQSRRAPPWWLFSLIDPAHFEQCRSRAAFRSSVAVCSRRTCSRYTVRCSGWRTSGCVDLTGVRSEAGRPDLSPPRRRSSRLRSSLRLRGFLQRWNRARSAFLAWKGARET